MYHEEVVVVQAYDHFSTEDATESECVAEFVGIIEKEAPNWLKLRHIYADISNASAAKEFHIIFKKAIIKIWRFELTQENESKESDSDD